MKRKLIKKPYSQLTDDETTDICNNFYTYTRYETGCFKCPLKDTKYCWNYKEISEDKICKCYIKSEEK